ncbi:MAG: ABC transporter permease [Clostridia bacterium]|nr:ABC transporter permease [Clostridia bacterium]
MSDFLESAINFYHLRLVPTVKRMLDRRRLPYTLLTVCVLLISATALFLLICHTSEVIADHNRLASDYDTYLTNHLKIGNNRSPLPEMRDVLALARGFEVAVSLFLGGLWLFLSVVAVGRIMMAVVESESYIYGLFMIYGADRSRLSRQLSVEFILAGIPALALGLPAGFGISRLLGGETTFPLQSILPVTLCFLLLILLCASVLSKRVLNRPCMRMLNAADTSDITISPRRSHLRGIMNRHALSAAVLGMWRLRRHFGTLALAVLLVTAPVFAILSPMKKAESPDAPFTLQFPEGVDSDTLTVRYLTHLRDHPHIASMEYGAADTAENLGIHVLADHSAVGPEDGLPLGKRYATNALRIACGDGDTFDELGGNLTIPEEYKDISIPDDKFFGYRLEAVPAGCAVYVYPEGSSPPLSLQIGDMVRLYLPTSDGSLPYEGTVPQSEYVNVRISGVVAVPSLYGERGGPEICPRITEDYLYLSPMDYEKFHGETHVKTFVAEEAYSPDLFPDAEESTCILVMPRGNALFSEIPTHVTVISPKEAIKDPFRDTQGKESLPADTYFINHTAKGVGIYLGSETAYSEDFAASEALYKWLKTALYEFVGSILPTTITQEYRVEQIIYTEAGSAPYLILPHNEEINYSSLQNDLCAFRLGTVSTDAPLMTVISEEAYLLETDTLLGVSFFGRTCYVGTTLLADFAAAMKAENLQLQLHTDSFLHTKTIIRNSFTMGNRNYLLADQYSFDPVKDKFEPRLQADSYPRVVTGTGSFCHVGSTGGSSILDTQEQGIWGLFRDTSIGSLKDQSAVVPGQYAYNNWVIAPTEELVAPVSVEMGHGILLTEDPEACPIQAGDILSVSLRQDTSGFLSDPQFMSLQLQHIDPLPYLLDHLTYSYFDIVVDEVREGGGSALAMNEADVSLALDTNGLHKEIRVFTPDHVSMEAYMSLYTLMHRLAKASGGQATLDYDGQYLIRTQTRSAADPVVMRYLGCLVLCVIPLLLMAAQFAFFEKRTEEFNILISVGIPPAKRRRQFTAETCLTAMLLGVMATLACPIGYLIMLMLTDAVGASLPYTGFDPTLCGLITLLTILSCLMAGFLCYLRIGRENRLRTSTRKETHHEGSGM